MTHDICGVPVTVVGTMPPTLDPILYEWRIYSGPKLTCLYVGMAKNGADRPLKTYPNVVKDLRSNRGKKHIGQIPINYYLKNRQWDFRWIHHELESCVNHILLGNLENKRIELSFPNFENSKTLRHEESTAIDRVEIMHAGTTVVANGRPCMRVLYKKAPHLLDSIWLTGSNKT